MSREPAAAPPSLASNLLIVAGVQLVLRLQLSKLQIVVASFLKISRLHAGMRQQFVEFGNVSGVAGLLRKIEKSFQSGRIFAHVPDQRVQAFQNLARVRGDQSIAILLVNLQSLGVLSRGHERVGVTGDRASIVVHGAQFGGQVAGFGQASALQVGLHERAQSVGMAVEVGNFFQILDGAGHVAGVESVAAAQQQGMTVAGSSVSMRCRISSAGPS